MKVFELEFKNKDGDDNEFLIWIATNEKLSSLSANYIKELEEYDEHTLGVDIVINSERKKENKMKGTFEVHFNKDQVKYMQKIELFLGIKFANLERDMASGYTIATDSEGFADEIMRIRDRMTGIDTFA